MAHTICLGENPPVGTYYADGSTNEDITKIPTLVLFIPITLLILAIVFSYKKGFGFWGYAGTILLSNLVSFGVIMAFQSVADRKAAEAVTAPPVTPS